MRNGAATDEDRGNAILFTRPLSRLTAVELPMERQRRYGSDHYPLVALVEMR